MKLSDYAKYQPPPTPGAEVVDELVIKAVRDRSVMGVEKYGTMLMTFNERDAFEDAAQEAVDGVKYLVQGLEEERVLTGNGLVEDQTRIVLSWYTLQATLLDAEVGELEKAVALIRSRYPLATAQPYLPDTLVLRVPWRYGRPAVFARKLMRVINEFRSLQKE
jgi:hypothetical protein